MEDGQTLFPKGEREGSFLSFTIRGLGMASLQPYSSFRGVSLLPQRGEKEGEREKHSLSFPQGLGMAKLFHPKGRGKGMSYYPKADVAFFLKGLRLIDPLLPKEQERPTVLP